MNLKNRLSLVKSNLDKAIKETDATWDRDRLIEARDIVERWLWHHKRGSL